VRTAMLRIGVVFGKGGGALEQMVPAFKFFVGGPIGSGEQIYSWVHIDDVVGLAIMAIDDDRATGPINATSPYPATAGEVAKTIGAVLNRPSFFKVPKAIVSAMLGEAAEIVTESQRVLPRRAIELGYEFRYARLVPAIESILGSSQVGSALSFSSPPPRTFRYRRGAPHGCAPRATRPPPSVGGAVRHGDPGGRRRALPPGRRPLVVRRRPVPRGERGLDGRVPRARLHGARPLLAAHHG
jgi:hypothetical protein